MDSTQTPTMDIEQAKKVALDSLGKLIHNNRKSVIDVLNVSGYPTLDTATESEVQTKVIKAISSDPKFTSRISEMIARKMNASGTYINCGGKYMNCAGCGSSCSQPANAAGKIKNAAGPSLPGRMGSKNGGFKNAAGVTMTFAYIDENGYNVYLGEDGKLYTDNDNNTMTADDGSVVDYNGNPVSKTGVGLFDTTTAKNLINSALSYWSASINQEANQTTQENAIKLAQIQLAQKNADAAAAANKKSGTGVITIVVVSAVAVMLIIAVYFYIKRKKK